LKISLLSYVVRWRQDWRVEAAPHACIKTDLRGAPARRGRSGAL